jgi:hypothetical protein
MAKKTSFNDAPKNGPEFKLNPGSTSILLIFVTLCLVAFAVLCVVSSNSDRKLGSKVITRTSEYYEACDRAQSLIADIDDELLNAYILSSSEEEYYEAVGGTSRSFVIDIDQKQKLYVELAIDYPDEKKGETDKPFYHITSWHVSTGSSK